MPIRKPLPFALPFPIPMEMLLLCDGADAGVDAADNGDDDDHDDDDGAASRDVTDGVVSARA